MQYTAKEQEGGRFLGTRLEGGGHRHDLPYSEKLAKDWVGGHA